MATSCRQTTDWSFLEQPKRGYRSATLCHAPSGLRTHELSMQLLKTQSGLTAYISRSVGKFRANSDGNVDFFIKAGEHTVQTTAHCMSGGQKCLLTQEGAQAIISLLLQNKEVVVYTKRMCTTLSPKKFSTYYQKIEKI
ncbi:MAG: hypothetical protein H7A36_01925 [Chlamydiales bacterium]|nr:hypothetical protein [Chlamydiales bacterium]